MLKEFIYSFELAFLQVSCSNWLIFTDSNCLSGLTFYGRILKAHSSLERALQLSELDRTVILRGHQSAAPIVDLIDGLGAVLVFFVAPLDLGFTAGEIFDGLLAVRVPLEIIDRIEADFV